MTRGGSLLAPPPGVVQFIVYSLRTSIRKVMGMTMKTLKMYLVALVVVFFASFLMYTVAKLNAKRAVSNRNDKIHELEEQLAECRKVQEAVEECTAINKELLQWKELAEQCVGDKTKVKAR